jgi:hypothetical protein
MLLLLFYTIVAILGHLQFLLKLLDLFKLIISEINLVLHLRISPISSDIGSSLKHSLELSSLLREKVLIELI